MDGVVATGAGGAGTATNTGAGTAITGAPGAGACVGQQCLDVNGTLSLGAGTFFNDAVAATARPIADCEVRNETWVMGETTLLPNTAV